MQFGSTNRNMAHLINTILTNTNITITPRLKTQGRDEGSQWTSSLIYLLYPKYGIYATFGILGLRSLGLGALAISICPGYQIYICDHLYICFFL